MSPSPNPPEGSRLLHAADAPWLAAMDAAHADPEQAWSQKLFASFLGNKTSYGCAFVENGEPVAFILGQCAGDDAEIINLVTLPLSRRRGIAERLVKDFNAHAAALGKTRLFLEVAVNNVAAIGLYTKLGFTQSGRRPNYYAQAQGSSLDALIMQKSLTV